MSSSFHKNVKEHQHQLLSRLIKHVAGVEEDDENFLIAYEFCDQNLKHHNFLDVNPREVDEQYGNLQARLRVNSMHSHAVALQQLHQRIKQLQLWGRYGNLNHSILQMLICLAGQPVDPIHTLSQFQRPTSVSSLEIPPVSPDSMSGAIVEAASDMSSSVYDPWDAKSDLSSWDEEEDYGREDEQEAVQFDTGEVVKWYSDMRVGMHEQLSARPTLQTTSTAKPVFIDAVLQSSVIPEHSRLEPAEDVVTRLTACAAGQLAYVLASQQVHAVTRKTLPLTLKCYTDSYVVHEVLQLLKGLPCQLFTWDAAASTYVPKPHVSVPYLSPGCLQGMLSKFGQVAARVAWLQELVNNLSQLSRLQRYDKNQEEGSEPSKRRLLLGDQRVIMSPGLGALGEAVRRQLHLALQPLLLMESSVMKYAMQQQHQPQQQRDHTTGARPPSTVSGAAAEQQPHAASPLNLLTLSQLLTSFSGRLLTLQQMVLEVLVGCAAVEQQPAAVTAAMIDTLVAQVQHWEQLGGPRGQLGQCMSLHLLLSCLQPLMDCLQAWMFGGLGEQQVQTDFFIQQANTLPAKDPAFWATAYKLVRNADGSVSCPALFTPLVEGILACGKALRLLHEMEFDKQREFHAWLASSSARAPHLALANQLNPSGLGPGVRGTWGGDKDLWAHVELFGVLMHSVQAFLKDYQHPPVPLVDPSDRVTGNNSFFQCMARAGEAATHPDSLPPDLLGWMPPWTPPPSSADNVVPQQEQESSTGAGISGHASMERVDTTAAVNRAASRMGPYTTAIPSPEKEPRGDSNNTRGVTTRNGATDSGRGSGELFSARSNNSNRPHSKNFMATTRETAGGENPTISARVTSTTAGRETCVAAGRGNLHTVAQGGTRQGPGAHGRGEANRGGDAGAAAVAGSLSGTAVGSGMLDGNGPEPPDIDPMDVDDDGGTPDGDRYKKAVTAAVSSAASGGDTKRKKGKESHKSQVIGHLEEGTHHRGNMGSSRGSKDGIDTAEDGLGANDKQNNAKSSEKENDEDDIEASGLCYSHGWRSNQKQQQLTDWLAGVKSRLRGQAECMYSDWTRARAEGTHARQQGPFTFTMNGPSGRWLSHQMVGAPQLDWLLSTPDVQMPPVKLLLQECMMAHLQDRVEEVGEQLLGQLLSTWGLMAELEALRNVFLVGGPSMNEWAQRLLMRLFKGTQLVNLHEYELEGMLQEAFAQACPDETLPPIDEVNIIINTSTKTESRRWSNTTTAATGLSPSHPLLERSVTELEGLTVRYNSSWLLSMITDAAVLQQYNQVLVFLLQVRWAKCALDDVKQKSWRLRKAQHGRRLREQEADRSFKGVWRARRPVQAAARSTSRYSISTKEQGTLMEMMHFVTNLQHFITDQLLSNAWANMQEALRRARTLDDVRTAHNTFLEALLRQCCLSGMQGGTAATWKHVGLSMRKMLDCVLQFCTALGQVLLLENVGDDLEQLELGGVLGLGVKLPVKLGPSELRERMGVAADEFHRKCVYMLKVLATKTLKIGGDAELEYLIMRLNYNGFYNRQLGPELAWSGK